MTHLCTNSLPTEGKFLIVATTNPDKFFEVRAALAPSGLRIFSLSSVEQPPPPPEETGKTFQENAQLKASYYYHFLGKPVLAEDSGLVIPALGGFPGIQSARIAETDAMRIQQVLQKLSGVTDRSAYYVCHIALQTADHLYEVEGRCDGTITEFPAGQNGFGYDPIFRPSGCEKTFGEMTLKEKSEYSHRGRACRLLLPYLLTSF